MRRVEVSELEDFARLPKWYRDLMTDALSLLARITGGYDSTLPLIKRLLNRTQPHHIVDFGSGGCGPLPERLAPQLQQSFPELAITFTDLYPNEGARDRLRKTAAAKRLSAEYLSLPVHASHPPEHLSGVRTMFTAFHHLSSSEAISMLKSARDARVPLGIFEATGRSTSHFIMTLIIPFLLLLITPLMRRHSLLRYFATYVIPLVPLGCLWDGIASNFRTFERAELESLLGTLGRCDDYEFEIGTFRVLGPIRGTYLLGMPR